MSIVSQYDAASLRVSWYKLRLKLLYFCGINQQFWYSREFYKERKKREEERKKAIANLAKKSPKGVHQTTEQRNYQLKVREMRNKWKASDGNDSDSGGETQGNEKDRQPRLNNLTPDYDLKLFMEAQATASEKIVNIQLWSSLGLYHEEKGANDASSDLYSLYFNRILEKHVHWLFSKV